MKNVDNYNQKVEILKKLEDRFIKNNNKNDNNGKNRSN